LFSVAQDRATCRSRAQREKDVEGAVDKAKLEEFRATNVALMKERDELKQRFEEIDPEEVRKLADEKRKFGEAPQFKGGEVTT
jgi:hypothetical protein